MIAIVCILLIVCVVVDGGDITKQAAAVFNYDQWTPIDFEKTDKPRPPPSYSSSWKNKDTTIFIAISHYRDNRCGKTLFNLFTKAANPQRVHIGLVEQRKDDETVCIMDYCKLMSSNEKNCPYRKQIKSLFYSRLDARGPVYGRYLTHSLMGDEEFCMQIDSHMDVVKNWDAEMLTMWAATNNEYAVLSTYVPDLASLGVNVNNRWEVPHLCQSLWSDRGMVRNQQASSAINLETPILAPLWSAGFSFSKCHAEVKVPNDPSLPMIFEGEEFSKFARLWTRGYDVYTPSRSLIAHDYKHVLAAQDSIDTTRWSTNGMTPEYRRMLFDDSLKRLFTLLGMPGGASDVESVAALTKYGLGRKRTLDQFIEFTGIDVRTRQIFESRCKDLDWVPFAPDADPWVDSGDVWGLAPEMHLAGAPDIPLLSGRKELVASIEAPVPASKVEAVIGAAQPGGGSDLGLFVFLQPVNSAIEGFADNGGLRTIEVLLLLLPVIVSLLLLAIWTVVSGGAEAGAWEVKRV